MAKMDLGYRVTDYKKVSFGMQREIVQSVTISELGEIRLQLVSGGNSSYQYVYRAGAGVRWEQTTGSFIFDAPKDEQYAPWLAHIVKTVKDELSIGLVID